MSDNVILELEKRGLLDNFSNKEEVIKMFENKTTVYCGFDPSFHSLQLGNFVLISMLRRLQKAGHKVICVAGGATGTIGDPSGKKAERSLQSLEQIQFNCQSIKKQLSKYIDLEDHDKGILVDNYDWWSKVNVIEYLRDYGKYFLVNTMLNKEVVKSRLETGISYAEFSYMILQSGDFDHLYRNYNCQVQIGGGDQWGNLTSALDFVKKVNDGANAACFTFKLITDSEGRKFGKSESGALYLDPNLTSPYTLYQYFINVSDNDVLKYLTIFDERPLEEIEKIYKEHMEHPELRKGQKELARSIVTILHGEEAAISSAKITEALFSESYSILNKEELKMLESNFTNSFLVEGDSINIVDALILANLAKSKREAREFVQANSIKINGVKVNSCDYTISHSDLLDGLFCIIKRGKKLNALIKFSN